MKKRIEQIKSTIERLSNITLGLDSEEQILEQIYNERDLINSSLIFMHIIGNIGISHLLSKGFNEEQITLLITEFAENYRQMIKLYTGLDMPKIVDEDCKKRQKGE